MADADTENAPRDDYADIIIPEIKCRTKVRNIKCKYIWTIENYKSVWSKKGAVLKSIPFSASNDTCSWFLELHAKDDDYNYLGLYLKANNFKEIIEYGPISGELKFSIIDSSGEEDCTKKGDFLINEAKTEHSFDSFIKNRDLMEDESSYLPQNTLTIKCEITFIKYENKFDFGDQYCSAGSEIDESNSLEEYEPLFIKEDFSDIKICINGKEYPAHRTILAARSPVFAAMLKYNTTENHQSRIEVKDIDEQIFLEALRYIYNGKVHDLEILAFELLPVADKYDLKKLKTMCEKVLFKKMSVETVVKILILADMHNVVMLKSRAIDYIKTYSMNVANLMDTEAWSDLTSRPDLMKDVLQAFMKR